MYYCVIKVIDYKEKKIDDNAMQNIVEQNIRKKVLKMSVSLSSAMIYFGCMCLIISALIFIAQHKTNKKVGSNKKLNDKIIFFKNKWQREHWSQILIATGIVIGLIVLSIITDIAAFIYLGGVAFLGAYLYLYNKMMIYVEANAFDGTGSSE